MPAILANRADQARNPDAQVARCTIRGHGRGPHSNSSATDTFASSLPIRSAAKRRQERSRCAVEHGHGRDGGMLIEKLQAETRRLVDEANAA
jgi:hypothetical protein